MWLHRVEEEWPVVSDGSDIEWIRAKEGFQIRGCKQLGKRIWRRIAGQIEYLHPGLSGCMLYESQVGLSKRITRYQNGILSAPMVELLQILSYDGDILCRIRLAQFL